jgi:tryptophan synthase beta chain
MVAIFQSVISAEIITQLPQFTGKAIPDYVIACIGGGSNAAGAFYHYLDLPEVKLIAAEAAGKGIDTGFSAATTFLGRTGILHGFKSLVMQTNDGQIVEAHSISAGLDYPGIGPLHAYLKEAGRAEFLAITDEEALKAAYLLTRTEGIIPALESAHAIAALKHLPLKKEENVVICLSGRGDKDMNTYIQNNNKD